MKAARSLAAVLAAVMLCTLLVFCPAEGVEPADTDAGIADDPYSALRLHVLAKSDEPGDQRAKLAVRDAVLELLKKEYSDVSSPAEAEAALKKLGGELLNTARNALENNGKTDNVQLMLGEFDFPEREYGNTVYPAGRYRALRIVIGPGAGHNWWCVLFPPLCVIESEDDPAEYNEDGTLEFKSAIAQLWRRIFG